MSRGKRYSGNVYKSTRESKRGEELNYTKLIGFFVVILLIVGVVFGIKAVLNKDDKRMSTANLEYFPVIVNNKWGVIDNTGNTVIEPSYDEMIQIPNNKKAVFICTYDVNYDNNTYKTKVINEKNQEIYKGYELVEPIDNFNSNNEFWYEDNVLRVKKDGKYGLINLNGKEILKPEYEEIASLKGTKGAIQIKKDGKYGISDTTGKVVIKTECKEIKTSKEIKHGFIVLNDEDKYGYITQTGEKLIAPIYEELIIMTLGNDTYLKYKKENQFGIINLNNNIIIPNNYDDIKIESGKDMYIVKTDNTWSVIDKDEKKILENYQDINYAFDNNYIVKKDDKYSIINTDKEKKVTEYSSIIYRKEAGIIECENSNNINTKILNKEFKQIAEGIITYVDYNNYYFRIKTAEGFKYYTFTGEERNNTDLLTNNTLFLSKKDNKYGFVDKQGNVVVEYIYDDATEQNEYGFVAVKKDGLWGSLDKEGKVVLEPQVNLDNNLDIGFIGKWHIGSSVGQSFYM